MKLRVLSYNTHKLFNITRTNYFLSELKKILTQMDLDFVFLQEIRGEHPNNHKHIYNEHPLEHLSDELWDHFIYGKNAIYSSGSHGNAILSKYPFAKWKNWNISNHRFEKRSLLVGHPRLNQKSNILLCCTHLDLTWVGRKLQFNKIKDHLDNEAYENRPVIICGDMNDWKGVLTESFLSLGFQTVLPLATYPSFFPILKLDRVIFKNVELIKAEILRGKEWKRLSDHLPIYAEFELEENL